MFFAAPKGLIQPVDLPIDAGLWEYDPALTPIWRIVREAKYCKGWELPPRHLMKLILGRWGTYQARLPEIHG